MEGLRVETEFQRRGPQQDNESAAGDMAVLNQVDRDGHSFTPDIYPRLAHSLQKKKHSLIIRRIHEQLQQPKEKSPKLSKRIKKFD